MRGEKFFFTAIHRISYEKPPPILDPVVCKNIALVRFIYKLTSLVQTIFNGKKFQILPLKNGLLR